VVEPIREVPRSAPSPYDAAKNRPPSARAVRDEDLLETRRVGKEDHDVQGARKVWPQLNREGVTVARCTLERLMRADRAGRAGRRPTRRHTAPHDPGGPHAERPADPVERRFTADRPIAWWVADITDVPTWSGMVSLAVVTDVFSRGVVGCGLDTSMRTDLPLDALDMAIRGCGGGPWEGLVHYSDRGSQDTSTLHRTSRRGRCHAVGRQRR